MPQQFAPLISFTGDRALARSEIACLFCAPSVAHGAACYFHSGFDSAAVLTHGGFFAGTRYHSSL
jgi:hypothetical protein